jgi:uridylate kinase
LREEEKFADGIKMLPGEIDITFVGGFKNIISKQLDKRRFFVFVGGGKICRWYQDALLEFGADNKERDWMGISISRLNAEVVKQSFDKLAFEKVITDPTKKVNSRRDVAVFGGWKPGWSTDYCSVVLAKNMGIKTIINVTNTDYVYDKDPNTFKDARALKEISWKGFRKLVPDTWTPGLSAPFDPRASKMAEILKIKVLMINGKHLERLEDFLQQKTFIGTIIQ